VPVLRGRGDRPSGGVLAAYPNGYRQDLRGFEGKGRFRRLAAGSTPAALGSLVEALCPQGAYGLRAERRHVEGAGILLRQRAFIFYLNQFEALSDANRPTWLCRFSVWLVLLEGLLPTTGGRNER
jgi:hypothetical protein